MLIWPFNVTPDIKAFADLQRSFPRAYSYPLHKIVFSEEEQEEGQVRLRVKTEQHL